MLSKLDETSYWNEEESKHLWLMANKTKSNFSHCMYIYIITV